MTAPLWAAAVAHRDGGVLDGVHLLWAPPAGAGYSVQGFDIQRRRSQRRPEPQCFTLGAAELAQLHQRFVLATPLGELSVRDAACPRLPTSLPDEPFQDEEPPAPSERVCVEFGKRAEGKSPNPLDEQGLRFTSFEPPGVPAPAIVLRSMGGIVGLDIARRLTIELAAPALEVELELIGFAGPVLVAALDAQGQVVAQARTSSPSGAAEVVVLGAPGIITVAIDAPADETSFVHRGMRGSVQILSYGTLAGMAGAQAFVDGARAVLAPLGNGEAYQNYPDANLKTWRTAYYGKAYGDLVSLKRERDPDRLLRFPQAIGS